MEISKIIAQELSISVAQVEAVFLLLDEGNTLPFIARYRKEAHGALDDDILRNLFERRAYLVNLEERMQTVVKSINEQGKLTPELEKAILDAKTLAEVEDLYRPYKPKRTTRASIARGKGLEPLANYIINQVLETKLEEYATTFVDPEKKVNSVEEALQGASDIIAEDIADEAKHRQYLRDLMKKKGILTTVKTGDDEKGIYQMYYEYQEPIAKLANHRLLAINRGEAQKVLRASIEVDDEEVLSTMANKIVHYQSPFETFINGIIADSYKRLIKPSVTTEVRNELTETAEEQSMKVFQANLRQLLLVAPLKGNRILGYDPAFRTGCKLAVIDEFGKVLDKGVIYPTEPRNDTVGSMRTLARLYQQYQFTYVAIGNGTASRESETFIRQFISETKLPIKYVIVNEAGASVYSASVLAAKEFPTYEVQERSAVSIARRLLDPLAELVKIDPKAIGVGQYQHDMNQKRLGEMLGNVVENCVNSVGINVNNASSSLLSYVSGISSTLAENIVTYRENNGPFKSRRDLLNVPKLGPKAYEQAAGFLRIRNGYPLDNTAVHPESYASTLKFLKHLSLSLEDIGSSAFLSALSSQLPRETIAKDIGIGLPTLNDIINELQKPGRDPRDEAIGAELRHDITDIKDLKEGMVLSGTVRNIMDFGVFVDIGVHENGLVHISELANKYVKHPLDVVTINDIVKVKVIGIDLKRGRISLSMKKVDGAK